MKDKKMRGVLFFFVILVLGALVSYLVIDRESKNKEGTIVVAVHDFDSCMTEAGSTVRLSYPRQCVTKDGQIFIEQTSGSSIENDGATLANPASVYCAGNGGALEIRTDETGGEYGVCLFADSTECEEWAFFRGECVHTID